MSTEIEKTEIDKSLYGGAYLVEIPASESGIPNVPGGVENLTFFCANGMAVVVSARADGNAGSTVTWTDGDGNEYTRHLDANTVIVGGSWDNTTAAVSSNVTVNGGTVYAVIGGSVTGNVTGDTVVSVIGGTVTGDVVGGSVSGDVGGDVAVNITGGFVGGSVSGGSLSGNVGSDITVSISGGSVTGDVIGGSYYEGTVSGTSSARVIISGGTFSTGSKVYGGNRAGATNIFAGTSSVSINTAKAANLHASNASAGNSDETKYTAVVQSPETGTADVFVKLTWKDLPDGTIVEHGGKYYEIGVNAFGTVNEAVAGVKSGGTITMLAVNGQETEYTDEIMVHCKEIGSDKNITILGETKDGQNLIRQTGKVAISGNSVQLTGGISIQNIDFCKEADGIYTRTNTELAYIKGDGNATGDLNEALILVGYAVKGLTFKNCSFVNEDGNKSDVLFGTSTSSVGGILFDDCTFNNGSIYANDVEGTATGLNFGIKFYKTDFTNASLRLNSFSKAIIEECKFNSDISACKNDFLIRVGLTSGTANGLTISGCTFNLTNTKSVTGKTYHVIMTSGSNGKNIVINEVISKVF